jgi:L-alanine-DL-glutamate epimerase-like enolase superfamily enzyme
MEAIFELPLVVEGYETELLTSGYERKTMLLHLRGGGEEGLGEDVSAFDIEGLPPYSEPPELALAGEWTVGTFCSHVGAHSLWTEEPAWEGFHRFRRWAFESAALDLALRQAGRSLPALLGREARPLRFVNSLGLGDPPELETFSKRLDAYPELRFKLDADARWSVELIDALAASGAVEIVDFKGRYGLEVADEAALARMYEHVLERFPDVLFEDPHDIPAIADLMASHATRISLDAPIREVADIGSLRTINVKPSRIGSLRGLFAIYAHCEANGIAMYSGGMGELGVGRGQTQLLSSMFHPDSPNDIAPSAYNEPTLRAGLPASPLPAPAPDGFRWA